MKNNLLLLFTAGLLTAASGISSAQPVAGVQDKHNRGISKEASRGSLNHDESVAISTKALKHFKDVFKDTAGSKWYAARDGFIAKITRDDIATRMGYGKSGDWQYSIRYYSEAKLPFEVRDMVKREYYDCSIESVEEIDIRQKGLYYLVHLQDKQSWKNVVVHQGELVLVKDMEKL